MQFLSAPQAGRVTLFLVMAVTFSGVFLLNYALFRRLSLWPALSCLLLHNWILSFGFIGYLLGVGLFLWLLALWVLISERPLWQRLLFGLIAGQLLFYCHLAAFGCFATSVAGLELYRAARAWPRERWAALSRLVLLGLPLALPLLILLLGSPMGGTMTKGLVLAEWDRKLIFGLRTLTSRNLMVDIVTGSFLLLLAVALLRTRALRFAPEAILPLIMLTIAWLLLPATLFFSAYTDARIPLAIGYLLIGTTTVALPSAAYARGMALAVGAVFLLRVAAIGHDWAKYDEVITSYRDGFLRMAPSSVLVSAREDRDWDFYGRFYDDNYQPLMQVPNLAVLDRQVFVPQLYADDGKQPLNVMPRYRDLYGFQNYKPRPVETAAELAKVIDRARALAREAGITEPLYLILINPERLRRYAAPGVEPVFEAETFVLYRIG